MIPPYFPTMTAYPSLPLLTPVYPTFPTVTGNPSTALTAAIPKNSITLPKTAITREPQTLVRSPGELEVKAQELLEKGIKAEQEGNLFYAGTCYYHGFTFYRETSMAPRAREAYTRIEGQLERRPKAR